MQSTKSPPPDTRSIWYFVAGASGGAPNTLVTFPHLCPAFRFLPSVVCFVSLCLCLLSSSHHIVTALTTIYAIHSSPIGETSSTISLRPAKGTRLLQHLNKAQQYTWHAPLSELLWACHASIDLTPLSDRLSTAASTSLSVSSSFPLSLTLLTV